MGKIAVIWGQIDEKFNGLLRLALRMDADIFARLVQSMPIGAKVGLISLCVERLENPHNATLFRLAKTQLDNVVPRRNAAMHGCWGNWVRRSDGNRFRVGIWNHQKPKERFYVEQLPKLYEHLVALLRTLNALAWNCTVGPTTDKPHEGENAAIYFAKDLSELEGLEFQEGDLMIPTGG